MHLLHHFVIDWDKVKSHDDVVTVLKYQSKSRLNAHDGYDNPPKELKKYCVFREKSTGKEVSEDIFG